MLVSLEISTLILFPNLDPTCLLRWFLSLSPANAKKRYIQYHKWRRHISTFPFPSQPSHSYSFPEELVLSCPISFELSAFPSMVKAIYYCCKSVVRKTLHAAPVHTFYRTLTISFLPVLPLSLYAILSLALMSVPWRVAKLFGLC